MQALTVPAELEALTAVSGFVKDAALAAGLDGQAAYRLRLAVVELVTNTITHGYHAANLSGTVELRADIDDHALQVTLEDSATPFDPSRAPAPRDLNLPADERAIGGLGVYLALDALDGFRYERAGGRNRSILVMNRTGRPAGG
jgi:anti-sigma regulatory factor (Ser/Thr protein kinase)